MSRDELQAALAVRRSHGVFKGWTLGAVLRHAHLHHGYRDGLEGVDYLRIIARNRREAPVELAAIETILAQLADVPALNDAELQRELAEIDAIYEEWRG
jgi:regulator of protease activity HflC (stomatin/prohibitin superfamily)